MLGVIKRNNKNQVGHRLSFVDNKQKLEIGGSFQGTQLLPW